MLGLPTYSGQSEILETAVVETIEPPVPRVVTCPQRAHPLS